MTDQPDQKPSEDAAATATGPSAPAALEGRGSRWERIKPRTALFQVAAVLVSAAAAVFIVGAIFTAGFVLGSEGGDEHGGHDGERSSQSSEMGDRGGDSGQDGEGRGGADDGDGPR